MQSRQRWFVGTVIPALFGAGALAGVAWPRDAAAGLSVGGPGSAGHFGPYSYGDPQCLNSIDPVNVVFLGTWPTVQQHADHHGGWATHGGDGQNFWDHGRCQPMHQASASNNFAQPRFHMRYRTGSTDAGGQVFDVDPYWGRYTGATAHHEDLVFNIPGCDLNHLGFGHAIDDQSKTGGSGPFAWEGGFNRGRADILQNWWSLGGHIAESLTQNWGNTAPKVQCNGNVAWSDGYVYYLQTDSAPTPTPLPGPTPVPPPPPPPPPCPGKC